MLPEARFTSAKILIIDDQLANVRVLSRMLELEGYGNIRSTIDPREALSLFTEFDPDLVLLDLMMPHLDGIAVIEQLRTQMPEESYVPILVLTADPAPEAMRRALSAGARDFLTKPFERVEVLLRIRNLLDTKFLHRRLASINEGLEDEVAERTRELREARNETLERLALAAEHRDDATGEHIQRVGTIAALVARALNLPADEIELLSRAAPLHDVGKIGVSDSILLKPGKLTVEEFEHVKAHPEIGARILARSSVPVLQLAEEIALTHHERWDGNGYPRGLRGEEIPLSGRIVAVADVFDALTNERPYKEAWPVDRATEEISAQRGRQFDPDVVVAFLIVQESLNHGLGTRTVVLGNGNGHRPRSRRSSRSA